MNKDSKSLLNQNITVPIMEMHLLQERKYRHQLKIIKNIIYQARVGIIQLAGNSLHRCPKCPKELLVIDLTINQWGQDY